MSESSFHFISPFLERLNEVVSLEYFPLLNFFFWPTLWDYDRSQGSELVCLLCNLVSDFFISSSFLSLMRHWPLERMESRAGEGRQVRPSDAIPLRDDFWTILRLAPDRICQMSVPSERRVPGPSWDRPLCHPRLDQTAVQKAQRTHQGHFGWDYKL